jgi:hypothetical protein
MREWVPTMMLFKLCLIKTTLLHPHISMLLLLTLVVRSGTTIVIATAHADTTTITLYLKIQLVLLRHQSQELQAHLSQMHPYLLWHLQGCLKIRCGARLRNASKRISTVSTLTTLMFISSKCILVLTIALIAFTEIKKWTISIGDIYWLLV